MRTRHVAFLVSMLMTSGPAAAVAPAPDEILQGYRALYPDESTLGLYRLDWVRGLDAARRRSREEDRPVLLLVVRNISGGGDVFSGHC